MFLCPGEESTGSLVLLVDGDQSHKETALVVRALLLANQQGRGYHNIPYTFSNLTPTSLDWSSLSLVLSLVLSPSPARPYLLGMQAPQHRLIELTDCTPNATTAGSANASHDQEAFNGLVPALRSAQLLAQQSH